VNLSLIIYKETNMRNTLLAATVATTLASAAVADVTFVPSPVSNPTAMYDVEFFAVAEYAIEAEQFDGIIGGVYYFDGTDFSVFADMNLVKLDGDEVDISTWDLGAQYAINDNSSAYMVVKFDDDMDYDDVTVGVAFNF
jgi:predicted porin